MAVSKRKDKERAMAEGGFRNSGSGLFAKVTTGMVNKLQNFVDKDLAKTSIKQDCKMVLRLTRVQGKVAMRQAVVEGFEDKDFPEALLKKPDATVSELLQPYRDEPEAQKVLDKLQISWELLEQIAQKVGARCDTLEQ